MRLIDADALRERKFVGVADWTPTEATSWQRGWNDAIETIIDAQPTVDAVPFEDYQSMERTVAKLNESLANAEPVVRCKECIHYHADPWGYGNCVFEGGVSRRTKERDFCSWGERRKDAKTDAVEVVRCKDCKHISRCGVDEWFFCAEGERRE